jgi:proton-coupled amino acid transporter
VQECYGTVELETAERRSEPGGTYTTPRDSVESFGVASYFSRTDSFEKTGPLLTMINLVKSFIGLGILAAPSGFQLAGFFPATALICINAALSMCTISMQTKTKERYGSRVKTYTDLGEAAFGTPGRLIVALSIALNQLMCCIGYVMFFMEQMNSVFSPVPEVQDPAYPDMPVESPKDLERAIFWMTISILLAMTAYFESMKQLSFISMFALASIISSLIYVLITDLFLIYGEHEKGLWTHKICDLSGLPYFFGIALFMFEGNAIALEVYQQTADAPRNFMTALNRAVVITVCLIVLIGSLSYAAYGDFTKSIILLNLKGGSLTFLIQIFYSAGILCSYCL